MHVFPSKSPKVEIHVVCKDGVLIQMPTLYAAKAFVEASEVNNVNPKHIEVRQVYEFVNHNNYNYYAENWEYQDKNGKNLYHGCMIKYEKRPNEYEYGVVFNNGYEWVIEFMNGYRHKMNEFCLGEDVFWLGKDSQLTEIVSNFR